MEWALAMEFEGPWQEAGHCRRPAPQEGRRRRTRGAACGNSSKHLVRPSAGGVGNRRATALWGCEIHDYPENGAALRGHRPPEGRAWLAIEKFSPLGLTDHRWTTSLSPLRFPRAWALTEATAPLKVVSRQISSGIFHHGFVMRDVALSVLSSHRHQSASCARQAAWAVPRLAASDTFPRLRPSVRASSLARRPRCATQT